MGSGVAGFGLESYFSEAILYPSDQTANREGIESNINSNYNIYWDGSQTSLLDDYPNAAAAYSLRALNSAYTGPAIKVRRSSDNEEQDINFLYDGSLNTESLLSFVGAGDGFVTIRYDQSGNGNDLTNISAVNQPKIVLSGQVITENQKPMIDYDGANHYLKTSSGLNFGTSSRSLFLVQKTDVVGFATGRFAISTSAETGSSWGVTPEIYIRASGRIWAGQVSTPTTSTSLISNIYTSGDLVAGNSMWLDGSSITQSGSNDGSINTSNDPMIEGARGEGTFLFDGKIGDTILYQSDQTANRAGIESNINKNYNIYWDGSQTGLLDDYPNAAAAYSLRALNSAYTGPAIEARRSSDDDVQDIGFLYDGSLDTDSLLSFAGSDDVFVAKWYDQSGEGNDVIQPFDAQQPQIVDLGSVVTLNGKPTILSSVGKAMYTASNSVPVVGDLGERSSFSVLNSSASGLQAAISYVDGGTNLFFPIAFNTGIALSRNNDPASNATAPYTANSDVVFTSLLNSTNSEVFLNGVSGGGVTGFIPQTGTSKINVFARYANVWSLVGQVSEIILYPSDQTANRVEIETNINNHYTIYP